MGGRSAWPSAHLLDIRSAFAFHETMAPLVETITCRSALNRVRGMDFSWSLNPYRGCAHACTYCFARRTHTYLDLDAGNDFSTHLFVKANIADQLALELSSPHWRRETVAVGTATDPYQPLEATFRLTRACLERLAQARTPVTLITKGPMVRRDTDVLGTLSRRADCTVLISIPTVDEEIWRRSEPGTAAPRHRLLAVRHLVRAGIRAGVLMAPLLPGISDDVGHLEATVVAAAAHEACFVASGLLYLQPEVKAHYYAFLQAHYPEQLPAYRALYPGAYAPQAIQARGAATVRALAARAGGGDRRQAPLLPPPRPQARSLFGPDGA